MANGLKITETGFRPLYHNYCVFPLTEDLRSSVDAFPGSDNADCILTYGYIDAQAGLTLEILACGTTSEMGVSFFAPNNEISSKIRAGKILDEYFHYLKPNKELDENHTEKLSMIINYDAPEDLEKTRELDFLDGLRHREYPDDVQVFLFRDGMQPELCWVRMVATGDHCIIGDLLNDPDQDFGYHTGDRIAFGVQQTEEGEIICVANLTPDLMLTKEDLEGGQLLRDAISAFNSERNQDNFIDVLEFLRDSYVWVPCNAVMGQSDIAALETMLAQVGDDKDSFVGADFVSNEDIRFIPDILQNGDDLFFPAFSSYEAMGEYGESFSKVEKHFLEVINLARNNENDLAGIVIDPFTEPFVLDKDIFDMVENLKSRIQRES